MSAYPPSTAVLDAVARFLRNEVLPSLNGAVAFNLRVSISAIDMVGREIAQQAGADAREHLRLRALMQSDASLDVLRDRLCDGIADGTLTLDQPAVSAHLRATAMDRIAIDQPGYSAYRAALARRAAGGPFSAHPEDRSRTNVVDPQ